MCLVMEVKSDAVKNSTAQEPGMLGPWIKVSSIQSLSHVRLFVNPWIAARQASLSITNSPR